MNPAVNPAAYERVLTGVPGGDGVRVAFCVESTNLTVRAEAATLAAGLARTLCDYGWDAFLVAKEGWNDLDQDLDVIVACSPTFVPVTAPGGPVLLGWAVKVAEFAARADLTAYDGLLAPSELAVDRLREAFDGPITVLRPAVDPLLFPKGDAVVARRGTPAADVVTPLVRAIRRYSEAVAVICESPTSHRAYGVPPLSLLHAVAAGALPVATSRLGLVELGLGDVNVAFDPQAVATTTAALAKRPGDAAARAQRLRTVVFERHTWRHRLAAFESAIDAAKQARQTERLTVGFFPNYAENPYQRMLYADTVAAGARLVTLADPIISPVVRDDGGGLDRQIFHLQWTAPLLQNAAGPSEATRRLEAFKTSVTRFRERGGRLVWTVHNVLPHELRYREAEIELCQFLAASADRIHVLGEETSAAAAPYYTLPPERITVIPHASYLGVYPDFVGRPEARRRLGLLDGEVAILLFGVIRPYKGLDLLLDVFDRVLASDVRLRLLVAGRPSASPKVNEWRERCARHPRIESALRYIEPAEVQVWMRAADLVVLPYQAVLNSGALHLALAFGRPVVAPAAGVVSSQVEPAFASTFVPGDGDDMVRAIEDAVARLTTPEASVAALAAAERWSPAQMSAAFYSLLESLVPVEASVR